MIELWKKNDTFKKSLEQSKAAKRPAYTFYDGPPFATGLPHYGHLLAGSVKDIVTRYKLNQHILMRSPSSFEYIFVQNIKLLEVFTFHTRLVFTFHTLIVMEVPRLHFISTSYYMILNTPPQVCSPERVPCRETVWLGLSRTACRARDRQETRCV